MGERVTKRQTTVKKATILVAFLILYMLISHWLTGTACFFRSTIGVPCPGCGLTRAYFALLSLDFKAAFAYHPLFWYIPIVVIVSLVFYFKYDTLEVKGLIKFYQASALLFVLVFIIRLIILFPFKEPLSLNEAAVFARVVRQVINLFKNTAQ